MNALSACNSFLVLTLCNPPLRSECVQIKLLPLLDTRKGGGNNNTCTSDPTANGTL